MTKKRLDQKIILAVWNAGGKGKSESLRQFSNILLSTYPSCRVIFSSHIGVPASDDFRLVVEIDGVILGVESMGDPNTNLEGRLVELVTTFDCDVILCTCRTRGETVGAVHNIHHTYGFQEIWTSTYQIDDITKHPIVNHLKGKHILELIEELGLI